MNMRILLLSLGLVAPALGFAAPPSNTTTPAAPAAAEARVDATFAAWDANKDHQLSLAEFKAGWADLQKAAMAAMALRRQFQAMDVDHNGTLESGEYANLELVKRLGKSAPPLSAFDANKDQHLQFAEYLEVVRKLDGRQAASPAVPK